MKTIMMQFLDELKKDGYNIPLEHYNSMLEIEKEQIIDAHTNAYLIGEDDISVEDANEASIKYYNQTYNQNK
jgi:hypothetical protein